MKRSAVCQSLLVVSGLVFSACTINVNQNANANAAPAANQVRTPAAGNSSAPASEATAARGPWTVAVCSSRASEVTLQAGPDKNDSQTFATWKTGGPKIYVLPARLQNMSEIYFQAIGSDAGPVELCVLYDGRPKQRVSFEGGNEDHTIKASDGDDSDCRCTQ